MPAYEPASSVPRPPVPIMPTTMTSLFLLCGRVVGDVAPIVASAAPAAPSPARNVRRSGLGCMSVLLTSSRKFSGLACEPLPALLFPNRVLLRESVRISTHYPRRAQRRTSPPAKRLRGVLTCISSHLRFTHRNRSMPGDFGCEITETWPMRARIQIHFGYRDGAPFVGAGEGVAGVVEDC